MCSPVTGIPAVRLATGGCLRFGSLKRLPLLDGENLVRRASRAALHGSCDRVIVITGAPANASTGRRMRPRRG